MVGWGGRGAGEWVGPALLLAVVMSCACIPALLCASCRYREKGIGGLYAGISLQLTKGVMSAAIMMSAKETLYSTVFALLEPRPA